MSKFTDFAKKYLCNKKILFGAYIAAILIILVIVISTHQVGMGDETMASEVKATAPETKMAEMPEERVGKEESRLETLQRMENEAAAKEDKVRKDSLATEESRNAADARKLERTLRNSLAYGANKTRESQNTGSNTGKSRNSRTDNKTSDELTEFEQFKQEMARLDSLNNIGSGTPKKQAVEQQPAKSDDRTFFVYKAGYHESPYFNSIIDAGEPSHIKAMVDEVVKAKQGTRVRIRLLDDITINGKVLQQNQYLYAHVSGFTDMRIRLSVTSILYKDKIYAVNLDIYDLDGYPGLYVPKSSFQEFMKDFSGNAVGNTTIDVAETNTSRLAQMGYDMLDNLISASRSALQKKAKTNKANIKYNTQVLLINANEKEKF